MNSKRVFFVALVNRNPNVNAITPLVAIHYLHGTDQDTLVQQALEYQHNIRGTYPNAFVVTGEFTSMAEPPKPPAVRLVPFAL